MDTLRSQCALAGYIFLAASTFGVAEAAELSLSTTERSVESFDGVSSDVSTYVRVPEGITPSTVTYREIVRCGVENRVTGSVVARHKNGDGFDEGAAVRNAIANATDAGKAFQDGFLQARVCDNTCSTRYESKPPVQVYDASSNWFWSNFTRQYSATAYYDAQVGLICTAFDDY